MGFGEGLALVSLRSVHYIYGSAKYRSGREVEEHLGMRVSFCLPFLPFLPLPLSLSFASLRSKHRHRTSRANESLRAARALEIRDLLRAKQFFPPLSQCVCECVDVHAALAWPLSVYQGTGKPLRPDDDPRISVCSESVLANLLSPRLAQPTQLPSHANPQPRSHPTSA